MFFPNIKKNIQRFGKGRKIKKQGEIKLFVMRKII